MFGVFIVFAVILFLILAIGLIFLRFSDVFLVFSIVAFMVLVVFAVMPVVVKRRQRIAVPGIAGMKGMKSMLDLVYDKRIFDMDDIFLDQDWGKEMIKSMLYDKIVFAYADPQTIREMFGKGKDFLDVDELIIHGPEQLTKREYIYSLTNQFRTILGDLKIDTSDVEDGNLFALLSSGKVIGSEKEFREELENLVATREILYYAENKLDAREINEIATKKREYYQKLEKSFKRKYNKVLMRNRNKQLLFSMVQVETGRSNETYPLTWFYRTLHEKLVTIFEKPWSEQEKYKQAYVVLYFFVSKFVRKKVADFSEKQENNIDVVKNLFLFPPMKRITEEKRVFFDAILSARRDISQNNPLLSLLPSPEKDDLFRYYQFYESLGEIGVEQVKTLMNHYKNIVGYIYRNRESVLVYDLIYGVLDLIYAPLFMLKTFPKITQVKRKWSENIPWKISFDEKDFRNKLGIRRVLRMSDAVRGKLSATIIACSIFSMTLSELESFMKALLVISFYTNARYSNPLEFIKSKSSFSGFFFHRALYERFYNGDTRFRIGVLVPVVISALKKAINFISYVKSGMMEKKKKRIEHLKSKRENTWKALGNEIAKFAVLKGKIRRLEESFEKQEETKQALIEKLTEIVPGLKSKEQISVPDFANKINGNYEFNFLDIPFIVDCYRYLLEMMMRTGKGFSEGIDGKYLLNKQIFVKELENALV